MVSLDLRSALQGCFSLCLLLPLWIHSPLYQGLRNHIGFHTLTAFMNHFAKYFIDAFKKRINWRNSKSPGLLGGAKFREERKLSPESQPGRRFCCRRSCLGVRHWRLHWRRDASWEIYVSTAGGTPVAKNVAVGQALTSCPESGILAVCDYHSAHLRRAFPSSAF